MDELPDDPHAALSRDVQQHGRSVRALARALVGPALADDLAQDVWLARSRPDTTQPTEPGAWTRAITRRLGRRLRLSEQRRDARQREVARPERQDVTPADHAALAESIRRVAEVVAGLPEPYRGTVVARFYEDQPPREIAVLHAVPVETVKSRLKRGLALVRERLDERSGGDRSAWAAPLLGWCGPAPATSAWAGSTSATLLLVLTMKTKLLAAALLLALSAALWMAWPDSRTGSAVEPAGGVAAANGAHLVHAPTNEPDAARSAGLASRRELEPPVADVETGWEIHVRDAADAPIDTAVLVRTRPHRRFCALDSVIAAADAEGTLRVRDVATEPGAYLVVQAPGYLPRGIEPAAESQTVTLEPGHSVDVRVVDTTGLPVANAQVHVGRTEGGPPLGHPLPPRFLPGPEPTVAIYGARSDDSGHARLEGLTAGRYFVNATHESMALHSVSGDDAPATPGLAVPGADWTVTMAPVHAAVVEFEDDALVSYAFAVGPDANPHISARSCPTVAHLEQLHPGAHVVAVVPSADTLRRGSRVSIPHTFLLRDAGWRDVDVELAPLPEVTPLVLRFDAATPVCRPVVLRCDPPLPDADRHPRPWITLRGTHEGRSFSLLTDLDREVWLPPGTCRIAQCAPSLRTACELPQSFEVDAQGATPQEVTIRRTQELTPCTLEFHLPDGQNVGSLSGVSLVHESGSQFDMRRWNSLDAHSARGMDRRVWLRPGAYECWAVRSPAARTTMSVVVPRSDEVFAIDFRWGDR